MSLLSGRCQQPPQSRNWLSASPLGSLLSRTKAPPAQEPVQRRAAHIRSSMRRQFLVPFQCCAHAPRARHCYEVPLVAGGAHISCRADRLTYPIFTCDLCVWKGVMRRCNDNVVVRSLSVIARSSKSFSQDKCIAEKRRHEIIASSSILQRNRVHRMRQNYCHTKV
jgi:hypothetical protein